MRFHSFSTWLIVSITFAAQTLADVLFTSPAAGAEIEVGTISVQWKDSGVSPSIQDLSQYTLVLMVGGNDDDEMLPLTTFVSGGQFVSGNSASGTIPSGIAGTVSNGFFFQIVSTADAGGTVINYSDRFNITGLTGTTPAAYRNAAQALDGSVQGPATLNDSFGSNTTSSSSTNQATGNGTTSTSTLYASAATPTTAPASTMVTSSSTPFQSTTEAPQGKSHRLSSAASAGIGAAAAVVAVGLIGALAFVLYRRRKRGVQELPENPFLDDKAELSAETLRTPPFSPVELDSDAQRLEAPDGARPPELDHMAVRAELEG